MRAIAVNLFYKHFSLKMKSIKSIVFIMLVACVLQACHNKARNYNNITDSSTAGQDTVADDDSATDDASAPDTTAKLNLTVDKDDSQFAVVAANGGMTEIALGKLAIQKGKSKKIKNFGVMAVKEDGKITDKLIALIKSKNISLPMSPDPVDQKTIEDMSAKSGSDFDKAYINFMIKDHERGIKLFTDESKKLQDPDLKAFAIKTLPVIEKHLDDINAIYDSMQ